MRSQLGQRCVDDGGEQVELVAMQASVVQLQQSDRMSPHAVLARLSASGMANGYSANMLW